MSSESPIIYIYIRPISFRSLLNPARNQKKGPSGEGPICLGSLVV